MVTSRIAATTLGATAVCALSPKITDNGFAHVRPSTCSGKGAGVSRLTMMKSTLHKQNTHQACIMKEMPRP